MRLKSYDEIQSARFQLSRIPSEYNTSLVKRYTQRVSVTSEVAKIEDVLRIRVKKKTSKIEFSMTIFDLFSWKFPIQT